MARVTAPSEPPAEDYGVLLDAIPLPALLLEPGSLRLLAGNAEAVAMLAGPDQAPSAPQAAAPPAAAPLAGHTVATAWEAALAMPPHGPSLRRRLAGVTSRGTPDAFEAMLALPDHQPRYLLVRARLLDVAGRTLLSAGLVDLTARHQAEQASTVAHRRLEVALAGADLGAWHWDRRTGQLQVSERWNGMLGRPPSRGPMTAADWEEMVHPDDLPWARALLDRHIAGSSASFEAEFRMQHRSGRWVWILSRGQALERSASGMAQVLSGTHLDMSAQRRSLAAQAKSEREARRRLADLEILYQTAPLGLAQLDRDLRFVRINQALADINGRPPEAHLGRTIWDLVPDLRSAVEPLMWRVLETGTTITGIELSGETPKAPGVRRDWEEQLYPVRDPESGDVIGIGVVCEEVTERKRNERARDLLVRELDHRVKNLFAIIGGLVTFTARTAPDSQAMRQALLGRIEALARAHDLVRPAMTGGSLAPAEAPGTTLHALLEALLAPFLAGPGQPERLALAGPPVRLGHVGAPPVALALHELATNAAKYGALSAGGGTVRIGWTAAPGQPVALRWEERGGPPATKPHGAGFGHRLVRQSCAQLGGEALFDWAPAGLTVELRLPADRLAG
jgi:PAS domain S-box-containing protein